MFSPTFTEEPGGSGTQVTTGAPFGSGHEMMAVTEPPAVKGVAGPPGPNATTPVSLLGSTPGSTQVEGPVQTYWKFPLGNLIGQVSVESVGFLISCEGAP